MKTIQELTDKLRRVTEKYGDELYLKLFKTHRGAIMYYDDSPYFYFDNLEQLDKKLDELIFEKNDDEFIECHMEFVKEPNRGLGLRFGRNQSLYYSHWNSMWKVDMFDLGKQVKTKIRKEPTPHDKLEVGKWYFVKIKEIGFKNDFLSDMSRYELYIGNKYSILIDDESDIKTQFVDVAKNYHEVVVDE